MNCPDCDGKTKSIKKYIKKDASISAVSSILELIALALFISAFVYPAFEEYKVIVILISFALAFFSHHLRYKKVYLQYCESCNKEFPIDKS